MCAVSGTGEESRRAEPFQSAHLVWGGGSHVQSLWLLVTTFKGEKELAGLILVFYLVQDVVSICNQHKNLLKYFMFFFSYQVFKIWCEF